MDEGSILFYDSGIGGLSTLIETLKKVYGQKFIYFADDMNCPYGNKDKYEIYNLVKRNILSVTEKFKINLIVIACNTITACIVADLRREMSVEIIGIEPAIVPALKESKSKQILVLATNATISQNKYLNLVKKQEGVILSLPMNNLAKKIEDFFIQNLNVDFEEEYDEIHKTLKDNPAIDGIVLGCTHYSFLKDEFCKFGVKLFDGNYGVAKRIAGHIDQKSLYKKNEVKIILSSNNKDKYKKYADLLLSFADCLILW